MGFSRLLLIGLDPLIDFVPVGAVVADGGLYASPVLAESVTNQVTTAPANHGRSATYPDTAIPLTSRNPTGYDTARRNQ
jgi:hypothetical protein